MVSFLNNNSKASCHRNQKDGTQLNLLEAPLQNSRLSENNIVLILGVTAYDIQNVNTVL